MRSMSSEWKRSVKKRNGWYLRGKGGEREREREGGRKRKRCQVRRLFSTKEKEGCTRYPPV